MSIVTDWEESEGDKFKLNGKKVLNKKKSLRIQFPTKKSVGACVYLSLEWSYVASKIAMFN